MCLSPNNACLLFSLRAALRPVPFCPFGPSSGDAWRRGWFVEVCTQHTVYLHSFACKQAATIQGEQIAHWTRANFCCFGKYRESFAQRASKYVHVKFVARWCQRKDTKSHIPCTRSMYTLCDPAYILVMPQSGGKVRLTSLI